MNGRRIAKFASWKAFVQLKLQSLNCPYFAGFSAVWLRFLSMPSFLFNATAQIRVNQIGRQRKSEPITRHFAIFRLLANRRESWQWNIYNLTLRQPSKRETAPIDDCVKKLIR